LFGGAIGHTVVATTVMLLLTTPESPAQSPEAHP
jgi:hypothetical protein